MNVTIVIPSLKPDENLISYVAKLRQKNINDIVVVDDGSGEDYKNIFEVLEKDYNCIVLTHEVNLGKGAGIKTATKYIKDNLENSEGLVVVDSDGQHSVEDVLRMNKTLQERKDCLVLGCREFGENTPKRSSAGNKFSSKMMKFLYGINLKDTQTGLRAVSRENFDWLLKISGNRYEYEMNMLISAKKNGIRFKVITIETIYIDNNSGSHYRPVKDSLRIFSKMMTGLVGYSISSIVSALLDIGIYALLFYAILANVPAVYSIAIAATTARVLSSICNVTLNKLTFTGKNSRSKSMYIKYYILWLVQLCVSILLVNFLYDILPIQNYIIKFSVDILLAVISYQVQINWVFANKSKYCKSQGLYYKICKVLVKAFALKKMKLNGKKPYENTSVIYVGHHQDLFGPLNAGAFLPNTTRIWVLDVFFKFKSCFKQFYTYTFTQRKNMPKFVAFFCSFACAVAIPPMLKSGRAIPVYRGDDRKMIETLKITAKVLEQDLQVAIFPDVNYADTSCEFKEMKNGFMIADRFYNKLTTGNIAFVPLCFCKDSKKFSIGEEFYFEKPKTSNEDRQVMANNLINDYANVLNLLKNDK